MKWYSAKGLFKSIVDTSDLKSRTIEESIIVVLSDSLGSAIQKAEDFFVENEEAYTNIYNQNVTKRYMNFCNVFEISVLMEVFDATDGEEIYSNIIFVPNSISDDEFIKMHFRSFKDEPKEYYYDSDIQGFDYNSKRYQA